MNEVFTAGRDWAEATEGLGDETLVINMGPQHPSTHGVLRLVLTLDGETVIDAESVIGYLHTGIEKNAEVRTWVQGVTFVTRMDYLAPFFNETAYCLAVEQLLGIEAPPRAQAIRVLMMELNRIASHLVWLATTGMELGALSMMLYGFREREQLLDIFEHITGLRMNHAFIRPGGTASDLPEGSIEKIREFIDAFPDRLEEYEGILTENPTWIDRNKGIGVLDAQTALSLGVTGPLLRAAGVPLDLRRQRPYCGYEQYDFEIATDHDADCMARYRVRFTEMRESMKIVRQIIDGLPSGGVMVDDPKVAWPAQLSLGADGIGNAQEYIRRIMGESMEALIQHFKLVTEGFSIPQGETSFSIESPRGETGVRLASNGKNRPWRLHVRDASFVNLQAMPHMVRGLLIADVIAAVASIDPVMGGVDR